MHDSVSSTDLLKLCVEFVKQSEPEKAYLVPPTLRAASLKVLDQRSSGGDSVTKRCFATLVSRLVASIAGEAIFDFRKNWLIHRLHALTVEHAPLRPGEIRMLRADVELLIDASDFSQNERVLLRRGFAYTWAALDSHRFVSSE